MPASNKNETPQDNGPMGYISAIVLGLNDALVELTGALAGFTMALPNTRVIFLAGLTTGVAATLSMAAAEFLSQKAEKGSRKPCTSAMYTGFAYLVTVAILLAPYYFCTSRILALGACLGLAALLIFMFTWVVSLARHSSFLHDFSQMLGLSFTVAAIVFVISWLARQWWGINV